MLGALQHSLLTLVVALAVGTGRRGGMLDVGLGRAFAVVGAAAVSGAGAHDPAAGSSGAVSTTCGEQHPAGRQVLVQDRLFTQLEVRRLHEAVRRLPYTFGETDFDGATPAGAVRDLDVSHLLSDGSSDPARWSLEQQLVSHLLQKLQPMADRLLADRSLALLLESGAEAVDRARTSRAPYRAYVNQFRRGDHPTPHRDAALGSPHLTVLVYANGDWKRDWGGETFFYAEGDHEVSRAVRPRPGRVVFFTGGVLHSARPPLPDVVEPRYSIALKFWLEPADEDHRDGGGRGRR